MMIHRILTSLLVFMLFGISATCEAGPSKDLLNLSRNVYAGYKLGTSDNAGDILGFIAIAFCSLIALYAVLMLIKVISLRLWKLIKFVFLGLVVRLPRKLWKEKLFIPLLWRKKLYVPALWASIFKLSWLLQVKKFRRPDIWVSTIPWGLVVINIILWTCDIFLCVFCLCCDLRFLFLLVPALILTYYLYVGVYWVRIVIIVLLVLACLVCFIYFGEKGFLMAYVAIGLILLLFLPKSNAWFRKQNGNVVGTKNAKKIAITNRPEVATSERLEQS